MLIALLGPLDTTAEDWSYTVSLGAGIGPDYEGSDEYEATPIPIAKASYGARFIELTGTKLRANVVDDVGDENQIFAGIVASYSF